MKVPRVRVGFIAMMSVLSVVSTVHAYPNGPLWYATDVAPYCAGCHASTSPDQFPEHPKEFGQQWTIEGKHLGDIEKAQAYQDLKPDEKKQLIASIKKVDANASISLNGPQTIKAGKIFSVTVTAKGGAGPVVGLALLDNDVRFQSRPISSTGFKIMAPPKITGPDGKVQKKWNGMRYKKLDGNINFAIVFGIKPDLQKNTFDTSKAEWTLRAPTDPGTYTIAAVFFYGTEMATPLGTIEQFGRKLPKGGFLGHSGRVKFSTVHTITVQ